LILAQPVGKQESDACTQRDAGTGNKYQLRDAKLPLYHGSTNVVSRGFLPAGLSLSFDAIFSVRGDCNI
jgi:hypothetical protein